MYIPLACLRLTASPVSLPSHPELLLLIEKPVGFRVDGSVQKVGSDISEQGLRANPDFLPVTEEKGVG